MKRVSPYVRKAIVWLFDQFEFLGPVIFLAINYVFAGSKAAFIISLLILLLYVALSNAELEDKESKKKEAIGFLATIYIAAFSLIYAFNKMDKHIWVFIMIACICVDGMAHVHKNYTKKETENKYDK